MNSFKTQTSSKRKIQSLAITFAIMFAIAFLALTVTLALWIFLESILLITGAIALFAVKKAYWIIEFNDTILTMYDHGTGRVYQIDELTCSSFILKQTEAQKKNDTGDAKLRDYPLFNMYDVQNFSGFEAYIRNNFR